MTANEALNRYLSSLNNVERIAKSRDIRTVLGCSRSALSNWRRGRCKLKSEHIAKINAVLGRDIFKNVAY